MHSKRAAQRVRTQSLATTYKVSEERKIGGFGGRQRGRGRGPDPERRGHVGVAVRHGVRGPVDRAEYRLHPPHAAGRAGRTGHRVTAAAAGDALGGVEHTAQQRGVEVIHRRRI